MFVLYIIELQTMYGISDKKIVDFEGGGGNFSAPKTDYIVVSRLHR